MKLKKRLTKLEIFEHLEEEKISHKERSSHDVFHFEFKNMKFIWNESQNEVNPFL